jgi:lipopolysaccharide/colanic/teichoic acid biosynthesis glycosyltransferase
MPVSDHDVNGATPPRLWGMSPEQLHDHLWASRGVQVVRRGTAHPTLQPARWYFLAEPDQFALVDLPRDLLSYRRRRRPLCVLAIRAVHESAYREQVYADAQDKLIAVRREYRRADDQRPTVLLTRNRRIAQCWQQSADHHSAHRGIRLLAGLHGVMRDEVHGIQFRITDERAYTELFADLLTGNVMPQHLCREAHEIKPGLWCHTDSRVPDTLRYVPPVWIGAGHALRDDQPLIGPLVLEDAHPVRPPAYHVARRVKCAVRHGADPSPTTVMGRHKRIGKRLFDVAFSIAALVLTAPLFPIIMLAIWLEDGRPFLFEHIRQTRGGRNFVCYKFRTMSKDADHLKVQIQAQNVCDGPQFYVENDPRLLRVGKWLRRFHLDELPQFFNVLLGQMNIIGPRPSPEEENQFCPAWRDARLSVHPGMTGLWQVSRTRSENADFQEWIRYDMNYVQRQNWRLDIWIIYRTVYNILSHVLPDRRKTDQLHMPAKPANAQDCFTADAAADVENEEVPAPYRGYFPPIHAREDAPGGRKAA